MAVRIKICGITNIDDALAAAYAGADALGFIFYPPSPRHISLAAAREIIRELPPFVSTVGVLVNASADAIREAVAQCRLDAVQLHGAFPTDSLAGISARVIRAVQVKDAASLTQLRPDPQIAAFVVDAFKPDLYGGTGTSFDLNLVKDYIAAYRIIIAGGLRPDNVGRVVADLNPYGVDAASGVESSPGRKDREKLKLFVAAVRSAELKGDKNGVP